MHPPAVGEIASGYERAEKPELRLACMRLQPIRKTKLMEIPIND
jgi:hypothetical protein